jgi:hypothetical protein
VLGDTRNPFDLLGLPPTATPEEITAALREKIEDAGPEQRAGLRALWERLLSHPRDRVLLALGAHPRLGAGTPGAPPHAPDLAAVAAITGTVTPPDELLVLPLASTAVPPPPAGDPLAALAAELGAGLSGPEREKR